MITHSLAISQIFHLGFMAVDFIVDKRNKLWILETNSMPGIFSFHNPDVGHKVNIAKQLLDIIIEN